MRADHLLLNIDPADGRIWLVWARPGFKRKRIKEITDDIMLCLCADISSALDDDREIRCIDRSVKFADGLECKVSVSLSQLPDWAKDKAA